ncbi:MAG TPA: hypothetical protein VG454_04325, partial [Gemmatimonadales bacterium]|nr:hypothetical protein [Gemmatimonadales bacterium]
ASGALTIGGVESLAGQVGVPAELVRQAADAMQTSYRPPGTLPPNTVNNWVAGPTEFLFERVVDGELPEAEYATIVEEIRRVMHNSGVVSQFGRSFSWTTARGPGLRRELEVAVTVRRGQTRITVAESMGQTIGAVFGGIGGGMGGGGMGPIIGVGVGALHLAGPAVVVLIPVWLGITYLTARTVYRRVSSKRQRELEHLANRLAALAQELVEFPQRLKP